MSISTMILAWAVALLLLSLVAAGMYIKHLSDMLDEYEAGLDPVDLVIGEPVTRE